MNDLAFFSLITLTLLRMTGLGIAITLFLDHKRDRFKFMMLGWLLWITVGIISLFSDAIEHNFLLEGLLVAMGIAWSLGSFLLFLGIIIYFRPVPGKWSVLACGLMVVTPIVLFLAIDYRIAVIFSRFAFYLTGTATTAIGILERKTLEELIGKAMIWFYGAICVGFFWTLLIAYSSVFSSSNSYSFYRATDDPVSMVLMFLAIAMWAVLLILFIHIEFSIAQIEIYQLKDKYSHDLGNILQAVTSVTSLLSLKKVHSQEELVNLEVIQQKCTEAATLVKEIRRL